MSRDQAHPVATSAWLSDAGTRWVTKQDDNDIRSVWSVLRVTGGSGVRFYEFLLSSPARIFHMLQEAKRADLWMAP